jgi:hypothetical protein
MYHSFCEHMAGDTQDIFPRDPDIGMSSRRNVLTLSLVKLRCTSLSSHFLFTTIHTFLGAPLDVYTVNSLIWGGPGTDVPITPQRTGRNTG